MPPRAPQPAAGGKSRQPRPSAQEPTAEPAPPVVLAPDGLHGRRMVSCGPRRATAPPVASGSSRRTSPWVTSARPVGSPLGPSSASTARAPRHRLLVVAARAPRPRQGGAGDGHPPRLGVRRRRGRPARPGLGRARPSRSRGTRSSDRRAGPAARRPVAWSGGARPAVPARRRPRPAVGAVAAALLLAAAASAIAGVSPTSSLPAEPPPVQLLPRPLPRPIANYEDLAVLPGRQWDLPERGERRSAPPWTR